MGDIGREVARIEVLPVEVPPGERLPAEAVGAEAGTRGRESDDAGSGSAARAPQAARAVPPAERRA